MSKESWASQEAYNWLANEENLYEEIVEAPSDQRREVIKHLVEILVEVGILAKRDIPDVDLDALVNDFKED